MQKIGKNSKKNEMGHIIMKINRFLIPMLFICACILFACGRKKEKEENAAVTPKTVLSHKLEQEEEQEKEPEIITYKVILKDTTLFLYEVNGETKKLITSIEINPDFYPKEDIEKLKGGIEAYCKEDGYEILENFAN